MRQFRKITPLKYKTKKEGKIVPFQKMKVFFAPEAKECHKEYYDVELEEYVEDTSEWDDYIRMINERG